MRKAMNHVSFHIPGHKGRLLFDGAPILAHDLTELPGLDNLLSPSGWIRELEQRISSYYGSIASRILTGGSTLGILSAVLGSIGYMAEDPQFCGRSSSSVPVVICEPNAHMSVHNAAAIGGASLLTRERTRLEEMVVQRKSSGLLLPVCRTVYLITRPTYEGELFELRQLIASIKQQNPRAIVVVDEAHGAHLALESKWNAHVNARQRGSQDANTCEQPQEGENIRAQALDCGADLVVQSFHKTLPALGTAAVLHYGDTGMGKVLLEHAPRRFSVEWYIRSLQTSSPSYLVLESIRQMMDILEKQGIALYEELVQNVERFYLETGIPKRPFQDIGKLLVPSENLAHYEERGIICEMKSGAHLLFMASIASSREDFDALIAAVNADTGSGSADIGANGGITLIRRGDYWQEDAFSPLLMLSDSLGRRSAESLVLYPPGNVLLHRGERITEDIVRLLKESGLDNIKLRTMV